MNYLCPKCKCKLNSQYVCLSCGLCFKKLSDPVPILIDWESSVMESDMVNLDETTLVPRSNEKYRKIVKRYFRPNVFKRPIEVNGFLSLVNYPRRILIIGSGTVGYGLKWLYNIPEIEIIGIDIYYTDTVDCIADAHNIPISSDYFDLVIIQAVLEHVVSPVTVVDEIYRVLKADGFVYAETPFLQAVHEGPYDFMRFTHSGHRVLFKNFEEVESGVVQGISTSLIWGFSHFVLGLFRSKRLSKVVSFMMSPMVLFDLLIPLRYHFIGGNGFYFLGSKSKTEFSVKEVIKYYRGANK